MENSPDNKKDEIIGEKNEEKKEYSWEKEGKEIINSKKKFLTSDERTIIHYCFQKPLPDNLREEYWLLITGAKELKLNNPNYYDTILNKYPKSKLSEKTEMSILLDIHRTFPEDKDFDEKKINSLKNVLIAYSRRNCTLGYCQGFNYIVGKILKIVSNEENAFWIFVQIIENILPINYYSDSFGIIIDNNILFDILQDINKDLIEHFKKYNFELLIKNILYKWLICLFSQNIKDDLLFLIWDILFFEGIITLFKTIIVILEKNADKLMEITKFDKLVDLFDSVHSLSLLNQHKEELLKDLLKYNNKINNKLILEGRRKWYKEANDSTKKIKKNFSDISKEEECCEDWDNCLYIKKKYDWDDLVVFQKAEKMEIIENFYKKKIERCNSMWVKGNKKKFEEKMNEYQPYSNLMVQRRIHKCPKVVEKRIKERMKSCINLDNNLVEDILKSKYRINKKIIKKEIKKENNNNIINDRSDKDNSEEDSISQYLYDFYNY